MLSCTGCKVVSIEEDRARKTASAGSETVARYTDEHWRSTILPELQRRAVPVEQLVAARSSALDRFGDMHGHRTGEGSPWTFVLRGEGQVVAVDRESRRGSIELRLALPGDTIAARMQTGPVVSGTAVRDSLDFISFNDFADQLQYAAVGNALTEQAMRQTAPALESARVGSTIRFIAAAPVRNPDQPLLLTPIQAEIVP